ncbi:hypothetical protein FHS27_004439 [Rhodopirellula rubra]|uniref:Uncharacterized protein n=1 Tax=Aporhodopirellula rubra TaxID=980271 RepID=A0A7W5E3F6_9BACT|nr:hypothetical protein [Aporhodopirellula rubra]
MEALTSRLSFSGLLLAEISLLLSIELPNIPSPTTASPFHHARFLTLPSSFIVVAAAPTARTVVGLTWIGHRWADCVQSRVRSLLGGSPTGLAESSSQYSYGLLIRFWLLSTLSVENAVTISYEAVTISPIRTCT